MQIVQIANNKVQFRGNEFDLIVIEKHSDDVFFLHTSGGAIRFEKNDTLLNNGPINSVEDVIALSPQVFKKPAKWTNMIEALENNVALNNKLFLQSSGPGYARLMFLLTRGEAGRGNDLDLQAELQKLLSDKHPTSQRRLIFHNSGVGNGNWSNDERDQMNTYFANHDFNITIAL